ncbi:helix-turn-helix domain-containing protein [Ruminococcaceae bacterium OttesenSCG-928-L11]|nr:helix-turn-helix domain-containing protein [Ruminococcaceae bacterium OttesenSCG-928-L11]
MIVHSNIFIYIEIVSYSSQVVNSFFNYFEFSIFSEFHLYNSYTLCYSVSNIMISRCKREAMAAMTLGKKLQRARKQKGYTQKQLAQMIDARHNSISNWENDLNAPDISALRRICTCLEINPAYLLFDSIPSPSLQLAQEEAELLSAYRSLDQSARGAVRALLFYYQQPAAANTPPSAVQAAPRTKKQASRPVLQYLTGRISSQSVAAGVGTYLDDDSFDSISVLSNPTTRKASFFVPVSGDSMEPQYHDGDILIVQDSAVRQGEIGIFTLDGHGYVKKRGQGELLSLNPLYDPIPMDDSIFCNGKVIGVLNPEWIAD